MLLILLVQAASTLPPDIAIHARVRAREVAIETPGRATLTVRAEPDGGGTVDAKAPTGRRYRDADITLDAEARIAAPQDVTDTPNNRE